MNLRFGAGPPPPPPPSRLRVELYAIHQGLITALCCWALTFGVLL